MSIIINGLEQPSPGISREECHAILNPVPEANKKFCCERIHREDKASITIEEYTNWMNSYFADQEARRHLRFGQAFCNEFNVHDPGLFNEGHIVMSSHIIWTHYVIDEFNCYKPKWNSEGKIQ